MAGKTYDVIVIGTGAGGGMAIKTLCEAGLTVCALNSGRRLDPAKDFRNHRQPYDMLYRGFGDPRKRDRYYHIENEYSDGALGARHHLHDRAGDELGVAALPRRRRQDELLGPLRGAHGRHRLQDREPRRRLRRGLAGDLREIAPYYSRVERMIGVASTVQDRPSNPDGEYLPPMKLRCLDHILKRGCDKLGIPYLPDRLAQLTVAHEGHPPCHYCGNCTEGCDTGSFFSTPWFFLPLGGEDGQARAAHERRREERARGRDGRAPAASPTWTGRRNRRSRSSAGPWWWPPPASSPRASC